MFGMAQKFLIKQPDIKFNANPFSGSQVIPNYPLTDR
jgi:hypothetical protein